MYHIFIHLSVDEHLGCFHVLTTVNSAAMKSELHASFQIKSFHLFQMYVQSGTAGLYGNSIIFKETPYCSL